MIPQEVIDALAEVNHQFVTDTEWPQDRSLPKNLIRKQADALEKLDPGFNRAMFLLLSGV